MSRFLRLFRRAALIFLGVGQLHEGWRVVLLVNTHIGPLTAMGTASAFIASIVLFASWLWL